MALQLVEEMSESFAPAKYKDTYHDDLLARIRKKVKAAIPRRWTRSKKRPPRRGSPPRSSISSRC
jgi:non-homologous end joining protein Ku